MFYITCGIANTSDVKRRKYFEPFGTLRSVILAGRNGVSADEMLTVQMGDILNSRPDYEAPLIKDIELVFIAFDVLYAIDQSIVTRSLKVRGHVSCVSFNELHCRLNGHI